MDWNESSTASDPADSMRVVRVTHPFHPLCGREYVFFAIRHSWSEDRVYFKDERGEIKALPIGWTSAAAPDPFVVVAAGRCSVRLEDLLKMAELIEVLNPIKRGPMKKRKAGKKS
jgi:hypothetical protein